MPLNDDPHALTDEQYERLITEAEATAEPCPAAIPPDVVAATVARLDQAANDG